MRTNCQRGYLYSIRDGKLIVNEGTAMFARPSFNVFERDTRELPRITINRRPWKIYNNFIWCPREERDDVKAVELFIEYEEKMIDELQTKYYKHHGRCRVANDILKKLHREQKFKELEESEDV